MLKIEKEYQWLIANISANALWYLCACAWVYVCVNVCVCVISIFHIWDHIVHTVLQLLKDSLAITIEEVKNIIC